MSNKGEIKMIFFPDWVRAVEYIRKCTTISFPVEKIYEEGSLTQIFIKQSTLNKSTQMH